MKVHLVNFSNERYRGARHQLNATAKQFGIDTITSWDEHDLQRFEFFNVHRHIMTQSRGAGFWLWKPFILNHLMQKIDMGDAIVYLDAATELISHIRSVIEIAEEHPDYMFLTRQLHRNWRWIKRDCFFFLECDAPWYHDGLQVDASFQVYIKSETTKHFLARYLHHCCNVSVLTDAPNVCGLPNLDGFQDHRHDQAVLALMTMKDDIPCSVQVSQFQAEYPDLAWMDKMDQRMSLRKIIYKHHRSMIPIDPAVPEDPSWKWAIY